MYFLISRGLKCSRIGSRGCRSHNNEWVLFARRQSLMRNPPTAMQLLKMQTGTLQTVSLTWLGCNSALGAPIGWGVCMQCSVCLVIQRNVACSACFDMVSLFTRRCVLIGSCKSSTHLTLSRWVTPDVPATVGGGTNFCSCQLWPTLSSLGRWAHGHDISCCPHR